MWKMEYWDEPESRLKKWLLKLPKEKFKAVFSELALLQECGNELKLPHSKALGKGLFELRERGFGMRVYYTFRGKKIIILLQAGDKGSQEKDIKTAQKRLQALGGK